MAVPTFLATSHRYLQSNGITDVDDIIDDFRAETVTSGNPQWSEPAAALFKSPVDDDGRWFDVLLTRIDATTLECRHRDSLGNTVATRRIYIDAGGTNIRYYTGEAHYCIESLLATPEVLRGGLVDMSPESQTTHTYDTWAYGYRNNAGAVSESVSYTYTKYTASFSQVGFMMANGYAPEMMVQSGAYVYFPMFIILPSNLKFCGRAYQFYLCSDQLADGTELTVPIDVGVTAAFRVLGVTVYNNMKLCVRAD